MKVGDLVQKVNPWKRMNHWMDFDNEEEPILVLRIGDCARTGDSLALLQALWTNIQFWDKIDDYEVISESR